MPTTDQRPVGEVLARPHAQGDPASAKSTVAWRISGMAWLRGCVTPSVQAARRLTYTGRPACAQARITRSSPETTRASRS